MAESTISRHDTEQGKGRVNEQEEAHSAENADQVEADDAGAPRDTAAPDSAEVDTTELNRVSSSEEQCRIGRAALARMIEPGDELGTVAIGALGVTGLLALIRRGTRATADQQQRVGDAAAETGLSKRQRRLDDALDRWRTRLRQADGQRCLDALHRMGGGMLIPEDPEWPEALNDLGAARPIALSFRLAGVTSDDPRKLRAIAAARLPARGRGMAVVGSREMTDYGARVAHEMGEDFASHGVTVISGGAYGIDAAAHRGALAGGRSMRHPQERRARPASTIAVMAGGLDRFYPSGHERLLHQVMDHGLLLSELMPGSTPTRHRFLHRNRLIAGLADGIVVVEARWRSGALSTAHHGLDLSRPVGAVPGQVYAATSAGCHRLIREGPVHLVTDSADAVQLIAAELTTSSSGQGTAAAIDPLDELSDRERRIYDALPVRSLTTSGKLCEVAGLPMQQILTGLSRLERAALAERANGRWRRLAAPSSPAG